MHNDVSTFLSTFFNLQVNRVTEPQDCLLTAAKKKHEGLAQTSSMLPPLGDEYGEEGVR